MSDLTSADMVKMLRGHYLAPNRPAGGLYAAEVGSPCGRRRADALWLPLTTAGGQEMVGHEIKVSRSDVLVELADPTKAEPWAQYCGRWWLTVSDPALVEGIEVPEAWGIMAPPSGRRTRSMTILRPAPKLRPLDPAPGVRRLLSWYFYRSHERIEELERNVRNAEHRAERSEVAAREASAGVVGSPHARRIAGIIHEAEKQMQAERLWSACQDADVVAALVDASATRRANEDMRHQMQRVLDDFDRALDPLRGARSALEKAVDIGSKTLAGGVR